MNDFFDNFWFRTAKNIAEQQFQWDRARYVNLETKYSANIQSELRSVKKIEKGTLLVYSMYVVQTIYACDVVQPKSNSSLKFPRFVIYRGPSKRKMSCAK